MKNRRRKESSLREKLLQRAKALAKAGYSAIPVHGNNAPAEPKRPAVSWRLYQSRIATEAELEASFRDDFTALGIICGRVSKLLVIDFDDVLRYQRFCRHLPQYAGTYTVRTKRGFHLYFRTVEKVPSHQFDGGDIKAERSYVVAPPSVLGSFVYRCINGSAERELTKTDIEQLLNYFHVRAVEESIAGRRIGLRKDLEIPKLYRRLAPRIGRNNALYRVASMARDASVSQSDAERQLIRFHVEMPGRPGHRQESIAERWQEAKRTIGSAYVKQGQLAVVNGGVPNSVRERLLKEQGSTVMARLLDIFALAGWEGESYFTQSDAIEVGSRLGLNRKSVMQALTGEHSSYDGRHIISRRYVEYVDIGGLNGRRRGRPVQLAFQVPSTRWLLRVLGARRSPSDRMGVEDVRSAKAYRMAVHREYIRRLSPRSSLGLLARRVGVNERTIRRYNRALDVRLTACVGRLKLTREALACLPKRGWGARHNTTKGFWLESGDGIRLPAWRHIGAKLLKVGGSEVEIRVRQASLYRLEPKAGPALRLENLSLQQFARLAVLRGAMGSNGGLLQRLGDAVESARERVAAVQYERVQLFFDSVESRIADDKVAETISGYLSARDDLGAEIRRPARRGIAYRMLKEFGNGNVYLALRSSYKDLMMSLARHALRAGDKEEGVNLLARTVI